jgi:hypothetical protein
MLQLLEFFEGIKERMENQGKYLEYLEELKGVREKLGECPMSFLWDMMLTQ